MRQRKEMSSFQQKLEVHCICSLDHHFLAMMTTSVCKANLVCQTGVRDDTIHSSFPCISSAINALKLLQIS